MNVIKVITRSYSDVVAKRSRVAKTMIESSITGSIID